MSAVVLSYPPNQSYPYYLQYEYIGYDASSNTIENMFILDQVDLLPTLKVQIYNNASNPIYVCNVSETYLADSGVQICQVVNSGGSITLDSGSGWSFTLGTYNMFGTAVESNITNCFMQLMLAKVGSSYDLFLEFNKNPSSECSNLVNVTLQILNQNGQPLTLSLIHI